MGQYFKLVNFTRREVVDPFLANDGSKFLEILPNGNTARLLMYLIYQGSMDEDSGMPAKVFSAAPEKRYLGRWAGEDISLVGDYAPNNLWKVVDKFQNITRPLVAEFNSSMKASRSSDLQVSLYEDT